jgi:hypothetical protein
MCVAAVVTMATAAAACGFRLGGMTAQEAFPGVHGKLVQAAIDGDTAQMERLVRAGADPNYRGAQGSTPLMWVFAASNYDGLEKLLELGADPNAKIPRASTMMLDAARSNDFRAFKIILEHGGDPNKEVSCAVPLTDAVTAPDDGTLVKRIDLLLAHGANINALPCGLGAAHKAIASGRFDLVLYLLKHGYNAHLDEIARWTRQAAAADDQSAYQREVLDYLRQHGAKVPD